MNVKIGRYRKNKDRKVKVKIHDDDVWSADETLTYVILPLLKKFRKTVTISLFAGVVDDSDVPLELHSNEEGKFWLERWLYVLDEMIWSFEQILPGVDWESQFDSGNVEWEFKETEYNGEKVYEMIPGPNHTAVFDQEGWIKYNDRINNGMRLFGRYLRQLWN